MINRPLISIITVCYNSEKTIVKTLESVLNQGYDKYEYIIIDGNSSDGTTSILKKYEEKFNKKMKFVSEKDDGIYDAMNKGIKLASGDIVGIINSDDWYENDSFESIAAQYKDGSKQIIYGYQRLIKDEKEYEIILKNHKFISERMISHPTCFISRSIYEQYGLYSLKYKISSDYEFMLRMNNYKDIEYTSVPKIISNFRLGGESSTLNGVIETAKIRYEYKCIDKKKYYSIITRARASLTIKKILLNK